jgi:hypothetical protein
MMRAGEIRSFQFRQGGEWRTTRAELEAYINSKIAASAPPKPGITVILPADNPDVAIDPLLKKKVKLPR